MKLLGAGHGRKALVAELIAGELARHLDLPVPDLVLVELDGALAKAEPDGEIQDLLERSAGTNFGLDFLPGALAFAPTARPRPDPDLAAAVVWLDAYTTNVDRTARNPNLIVWHRRLHLIDHGSALYIHHTGPSRTRTPGGRSPRSATTSCCRSPSRSGRRRPAGADASTAAVLDGHRGVASRTTGSSRSRGCRTRTRIARHTSPTCSRGSRRRGRSWRRRTVPEPRTAGGAPGSRSSTRSSGSVPRVERGEAFNAGIVLDVPPAPLSWARGRSWTTPSCRPGARTATRETVREHLERDRARSPRGDADAGPIAAL